MYESKSRSWLKHIDFIVVDFISLTIAFWLAFYLRHNSGRPLAWPAAYRSFYLVVALANILSLFALRNYSNIVRRSFEAEFKAVLKQVIAVFGISISYLIFTRQAETYSRIFHGIFIISYLVLTYGFRLIWKQRVRSHLRNSDKQSRLLLMTSSTKASECLQAVLAIDYQSFEVAGIVYTDFETISKDDQNASFFNVPVVAGKQDFLEYLRLNVVDQVLLQVDSFDENIYEIIDRLLSMGIVVHVNLEKLEELPNKNIGTIGNLAVVTTSFKQAGMLELFCKRLMDIAGAIVGLVITAIAFIFVAPAIILKSPGPVFFSQERIGRNGRKFRIYKFRSMYMDAEERKKELMNNNKMQGLMFKMDNDPRIIKGIGSFIRSTSIDELPQFWNILKGEMSLVGTRPPTVDEFEQYSPHHKIRLSFRPGLTGLWQVSGRSDITDFEEVVILDEQYIKNWSIWLDVQIILKTIKVVLQRRGSE